MQDQNGFREYFISLVIVIICSLSFCIGQFQETKPHIEIVPCLSLGFEGNSFQTINEDSLISNSSNVKNFFDNYIPNQMNNNSIPGAVISIVSNDSLIYQEGYGFADEEKQITMNPQSSRISIGSITKLLTWTAIMQLYEQSFLELNADIRQYLEETNIRFGSEYNEPITILDLMGHTAGFEETYIGDFALDSEHIVDLETYLTEYVPVQVYQPGKVISYSNYGATLAGYLIEIFSSQLYHDYISSNILEPLNMTESFIGNLDFSNSFFNPGYMKQNNYIIQKSPEYVNIFPSVGGYSTAQDMAYFMMSHLNNGTFQNTSILAANTTSLMHQPHFTMNAKITTGWAHGFMNMRYKNYTLLGHTGNLQGYTTNLMLIPEKNIGIFIGYNLEGLHGESLQLIYDFIENFFECPEIDQISNPTTEISELRIYEGNYRTTRKVQSHIFQINNVFIDDISITIDKDGYLIVDKESKYIMVEKNLFRHTFSDIYLEFQLDEKGEIKYLLFENDPTQVFERIHFWQNQFVHRTIGSISFLIVFSGIFVTTFSFLSNLQKKRLKNTVKKKLKVNLEENIQKSVENNQDSSYFKSLENLCPILTFFISFLLIIGMVGIILLFVNLDWSKTGSTQLLFKFFLTLPLIARILIYFNIIILLNMWKDLKFDILTRLYYTLFELGAIVVILWLYYWKILGYNI